MDRLGLSALSGLSSLAGRSRRIQRQIHGQPIRTARRLLRHAALAYPFQLSELLLPGLPLAVQWHPARTGCITMASSNIALADRLTDGCYEQGLPEVLRGLLYIPRQLSHVW